jgi:hypothetical protein
MPIAHHPVTAHNRRCRGAGWREARPDNCNSWQGQLSRNPAGAADPWRGKADINGDGGVDDATVLVRDDRRWVPIWAT